MAIVALLGIETTTDPESGFELVALTLPDGWRQTQQGSTGLHVLVDPLERVYFAWLEVARPTQGAFFVFGESGAARSRLKAFAERSPRAWTRRELAADNGTIATAIKAAWKDRRSRDLAGDVVPDGRHVLAARRTVAGYDHAAEDDASPATIGDMT